MHERIRKFSIEGTRAEGEPSLFTLKDTVRIMLEDKMRMEGHIPNLDCGLHWSMDWTPEKEHYLFKMTIYGIFVGKERANGEALVYYDGKVHNC